VRKNAALLKKVKNGRRGRGNSNSWTTKFPRALLKKSQLKLISEKNEFLEGGVWNKNLQLRGRSSDLDWLKMEKQKGKKLGFPHQEVWRRGSAESNGQ